jgi:hypothetical protein
MAEEQDKRAAPGNRTMQIDALPDIELIDNAVADAKARSEAASSPMAPPPLPPRAGPPRVPWLVIGVTVVVTGGLGALGAYFLVPAAAPPAALPAAAAPPPSEAPSAGPSGGEAPVGEAPAEVNRVTLEEEVLIGIEAPDAGLTPSE